MYDIYPLTSLYTYSVIPIAIHFQEHKLETERNMKKLYFEMEMKQIADLGHNFCNRLWPGDLAACSSSIQQTLQL